MTATSEYSTDLCAKRRREEKRGEGGREILREGSVRMRTPVFAIRY